ncbi:hypothetical protein F2Q69_00024149 [Brassica cretica]|uniref:Uncharacterized protein n=1 Tax=Brassica cretica TaxID=69181 RepID=A0A8S9PZ03_BRACR|nr:hypothetical protein F2Q69_00024149 [Brassica cretica]
MMSSLPLMERERLSLQVDKPPSRPHLCRIQHLSSSLLVVSSASMDRFDIFREQALSFVLSEAAIRNKVDSWEIDAFEETWFVKVASSKRSSLCHVSFLNSSFEIEGMGKVVSHPTRQELDPTTQ